MLAGQERWDEAVSAAERAQAVAQSGEARAEVGARVAAALGQVRASSESARQRTEYARDTERLLAELHEARDPGWGQIDPDSTAAGAEVELSDAYAAAFGGHGLDVDGSSPEAIAAALGERGLGADVALFLDAWSDARRDGNDDKGALHLLMIAHLVDPDPVRADLREAVANGDAEMLSTLARGNLAAQPPATLELLAAALLRLEDREGGLRVLREAVGIHPEDVSLHVALARVLTPGNDAPGNAVQRAEFLEALTHDWAALALRPETIAVRFHLGRVYHRLGEHARSAELLQTATDADPENATIRLGLGMALADAHADVGRTKRELRRARELSEVWWIQFWSQFYEALVLNAEGDLEQALEHCRKALEIRPGNARAASLALQLQVKRGDLDGALQQLEQSLTFSGSPLTLYNDLAWFLASTPPESFGGPDQAARCADEAVRLSELAQRMAPQDPNCFNTLSIARLRAGDAEGALAAAQQAMVLGKGGLPQDWLALSLAYCALGDRDQARLWYELADSTFVLYGFGGEDLRYLHGEAARALGLPRSSAR